MIQDSYEYFDLKDSILFSFESEGANGIILKIIIFTLNEDGTWNLAFGDWQNNDINDSVISNNQDIVRVISTVAKVTYVFFDNYPDATVVIKPVDEKRKKLYNIVFKRHYDVITLNFHIFAIINREREIYSPDKQYDSFELSLKSK
jgi:hypothetical protein